MKFILGQKKQMTQVFKTDGTVIPVTVVEATPNTITQVKTPSPLDKGGNEGGSDGYHAIQFGSGVTKKSHRRPQLGHLKDLKPSRWLREFRLTEQQAQSIDKFMRGMTFGVGIFRPGDKVRVVGTSKGRGFQGVVKRHGFHGSPASHGHKDQLRMPGSIGATGPAKVVKGKKMPGRMGADRITVDGLQVVKVDREKNLLYISGALPGAINSLVMISGPGTFKLETKKLRNKEIKDQHAVNEVKELDEVEEKEAAEAVKEVEDVQNVENVEAEEKAKNVEAEAGAKKQEEKPVEEVKHEPAATEAVTEVKKEE